MLILSQDRDETFTLKKINRIYTQEQRYKGCLIGFNIIGKQLFKQVLLGTYDADSDAQQIVTEIYRLYKTGAKHYAMPDAVLDIEDWGCCGEA